MNTTVAVVEKNVPIQSSMQDPFPLLKLPRELRDSIYRYPIAAGDLSILRTSKFVNAEASQLLSKDAVFRVDFVNKYLFGRTDWSKMISGSINLIQNLDLRLYPPGMLKSSVDFISSFTGSQVVRKSCVVRLRYPDTVFAQRDMNDNRLYLELKRLNGFKTLVFKLMIEYYAYLEVKRRLTRGRLDDTSPYEPTMQQPHRDSYLKLQRYLAYNLGPSEFDESLWGHGLKFHPLEPVPEGWCPEKVDGIPLPVV